MWIEEKNCYNLSAWSLIGEILHTDTILGMPFGAAKLTLALSSVSTAQDTKTDLRTQMKETFETLAAKFPRLKEQADSVEGVNIYFCGGGFRGYGSMLMHTDPIQPYPISSIGGYTVPGNQFMKWREMLHTNNYEEGKIFGMSKRRREQFPAIVTVVQSLVEAIPKIGKVTFCSGGNREGVLYMKLPKQMRESHPVPLFPFGGISHDADLIQAVTNLIITALPSNSPIVFSKELIHYLVQNLWQDLGEAEDANSARAIHLPTSGDISGLPGLTHETRGILALSLCERWGSDLGTADLKLRDSLRALVGLSQGWWCDYIGTICRLIGTLIPVFPSSKEVLAKMVSFKAATSHGLGKKGHKVGIRLTIKASKASRLGLNDGTLEDLFSKVGKGTSMGWKVEAEIEDI